MCGGCSLKRVRFSEDTKMDSTFFPNSIPENHFHLSGNNYAVVSNFADVLRIHLRLYKPGCDGRLTPTKEGVALAPAQWLNLMKQMDSKLPSESSGINSIQDELLICTEYIENVPYVSLQRFFQNKKDLSRKFVNSICLLGESEWKELKRIRDEVTSTAVNVMFGRVLKTLILREIQHRTSPTTTPGDNDDAEIILTTSITELLKDYLQSNIAEVFVCNGCDMDLENQLGHECLTYDREFRVRLYGDKALLKIDLNKFVKEFVERNIAMVNYINERYINSLNISNLIKAAIDLYVSSDPNPFPL
jgi:hypothetical protein